MAEEPSGKKEESDAPASSGAKKILEELEKSAAAASAAPAQSVPAETSAEAAPASAEISPPAAETAPAATPAEDTPDPSQPAVQNMKTDGPLITDAMRRLDELLARFRNPS